MTTVTLTDEELHREALQDLEVACAEMYGEATGQLKVTTWWDVGDPAMRANQAIHLARACLPEAR